MSKPTAAIKNTEKAAQNATVLRQGNEFVFRHGRVVQEPIKIVPGVPGEDEDDDGPMAADAAMLLGFDPDDMWDKQGNLKVI
jgi:hypothetical protein